MSFASPDCLSTLNESTTTVEDYRTQVTYYDTTLLDQLVGLSDKHLDLDDWGFSGDLKEKTRKDRMSNKTSQENMGRLGLMVSSVAGKPGGAARLRLAFPF